MHYIFPAAGLGKRFRDNGFQIPKPLIRVHGIALLVWAISNFPIKKHDQIWIISQKDHEIADYLKLEFPQLHQKCMFVTIDEITDGPATTVSLVAQKIQNNEPITIANTDQYVFRDLSEFTEISRNKRVCGSILTMEAMGNQWSYITKNLIGDVKYVVEKKQISNEATVGVYGFKTSASFMRAYSRMREVKDTVNNEFYVAPMFNYLIEANCKIVAHNIGKIDLEVFGTGTPADLSRFEQDLRLLEISKEVKKQWT